MSGTVVDRAREASRGHLRSALPRRWAHVQAVAVAAQTVADGLDLGDKDEVVAAAWLHDVGYARELEVTGFHPVDGAAFARAAGFPALVVSLIAYHTGAVVEAQERGLEAALAVFAPPPAAVLDVVTFADMTTGPDGSPVDPTERVEEILSRYPADDPVARAVSRSGPGLLAAVARVEERLLVAASRSGA